MAELQHSKIYVHILILEPVNVTLFGKGIFADAAIQFIEMKKSSWIICCCCC